MRKRPLIMPAAPGLIGMMKTTMVGFDCPVQHPAARTATNAGLMIGTTETAAGPGLIVSIAHEDGTANAAFISLERMAGFLDLTQRQAQRVFDMAQAPADKETTQ